MKVLKITDKAQQDLIIACLVRAKNELIEYVSTLPATEERVKITFSDEIDMINGIFDEMNKQLKTEY